MPLKLSAICVCLFALAHPTDSLAQSSLSAQSRQWHVGTFAGHVTQEAERMLITVKCESEKVCEYVFEMEPRDPARVSRTRADNIQVIDTAVPNNNLRHTREAVKAETNLYGNERDGPLLLALRPLLESSVEFENCVGVSELAGAWGRLCKLRSEGTGLPMAALLLPTMNPTCNRQPFCAYYIFPLRRTEWPSGG